MLKLFSTTVGTGCAGVVAEPPAPVGAGAGDSGPAGVLVRAGPGAVVAGAAALGPVGDTTPGVICVDVDVERVEEALEPHRPAAAEPAFTVRSLVAFTSP